MERQLISVDPSLGSTEGPRCIVFHVKRVVTGMHRYVGGARVEAAEDRAQQGGSLELSPRILTGSVGSASLYLTRRGTRDRRVHTG